MNTEIETIETKSKTITPSDQRPTHPNASGSRRTRFTVIASVAIVLAAGFGLGIIPRLRAQTKRPETSHRISRQSVAVITAARATTSAPLLLPGDVHAFEQTKIYARADGYLLKWNVDIGAKVLPGQILAEIDTPELDQELNQSRAALAQAHANLVLAKSSAERWQGLLKDRAVSQQEVDERNSALTARQADVKAAEAAVLRFEKLAGYKQVRAPFAGTVTRRLVDTGALIRGGANASALFELANVETLRIHVNLPQAYLRDIQNGLPARIRVAEYPDRVFTGRVARTSGAFDTTTRTMLTEIEASNSDGALYPGIHVEVQLALTPSNPPIIVPATALLTRSEGLHVAVVNDSETIHVQKIQIGRDLGRTLEIVSGLEEGARVVTHPSDTLADGFAVKVASADTGQSQGTQLAKR